MLDSSVHEDWKGKYRELLGELEDKQSAWRHCEKMLRQTAARLGIAAMGRDATVDRQLEHIVELVKSPGSEKALHEPLESLARAVVEQEQTSTSLPKLDLAGFVTDLPLPADDRRRVLDAMAQGGPAAQAKALVQITNSVRQLLITPNENGPSIEVAVRGLLLGLHEISASLPELEDVLIELDARIRDEEVVTDWDPLLRKLARTIGQAVLALQDERAELESFLEQVTDRLAEFDAFTISSLSEAKARAADTVDLEQGVQQQVGSLQADVQSSKDIGDLKSRVEGRLDNIADQMKSFREREEERARAAEQRHEVLQEQVNRLRVRTTELATLCGEQEHRLMHDTLTGVHSRHAYDQRLQEEFQRWQRHGQPLTYALWDIDHFKDVNDNYGHQAGDYVLKAIAKMLSQSTRTEDFIARIGGEEFVVLFVATNAENAAALSDRLREQIAATTFEYEQQKLNVTVSCGMTEFLPNDTPQGVYERADQALYAAKNAGRNRCVQR